MLGMKKIIPFCVTLMKTISFYWYFSILYTEIYAKNDNIPVLFARKHQ